jgi:hypothetical protein
MNIGNKTKSGRKDLKLKGDSSPRRSLQRILQQGEVSSGTSLKGPVATSKPAVELSANGRDEPVVRNLPEVKPETTPLEVSSTD